jgi:hypothetical protein
MRIWYLAPDFAEPSWGVGMLYGHVELLRRDGRDAVIVHTDSDFRPPWLDSKVPVVGNGDLRPASDDVVVVPEVLVDDPRTTAGGRAVLFVQNVFSLLERFEAAVGARARGFVHAMAVLPHARDAIRVLADLPSQVVPPYVAPYFTAPFDELVSPRFPRVVVHAKSSSRELPVARRALELVIAGALPGLVGGRSQHELSRWEIVELRGLTHHEAAETLREACLFVNLNCFEAFNTTVPEAMAAGAVPVCYEAYGGRDFLRDGDNAFVFPNNSLLPLIERVVDLMAAPEPEREARLVAIRQRAWETAARYTPEATAVALREFFDGMGR